MSLGTEPASWFAVQVRTRWESSTALLLSGKGCGTLLPTHKVHKGSSGRIREASVPLFPGYVFCQFDVHKRLPVLVTPGVIAIVGCGKTPIPVDETEIEGIRELVSSGVKAEPWPFLKCGQRVRVETDALRGLEGILVQFKGNHRIVLSVSLLQRSVALEIDKSCVRPIGPVQTPMFGAIGSQGLLPAPAA